MDIVAPAREYPLVSVRIPAYNHERFIERCLASVIDDDYPNKELIIIDDGSSDRTYEIIQTWAEKNRLKLSIRYYTQKNVGLCTTLNRLVDLGRGEFLVSLASDDMLLPNGIAQRVKYLQEHPDDMAVIGDCRVIDENDMELYASAMEGLFHVDKRRYQTKDGIKREIVGNWAVPGPALMVRKGIYKVVGKYDSRYLVEDWHFYLRIVERNLLGFVPELVSSYRLHGSNQSQTTHRIKCLWDQIRIAATRMRHFELRFQLQLVKRMLLCGAAIVKSLVIRVFPRYDK